MSAVWAACCSAAFIGDALAQHPPPAVLAITTVAMVLVFATLVGVLWRWPRVGGPHLLATVALLAAGGLVAIASGAGPDVRSRGDVGGILLLIAVFCVLPLGAGGLLVTTAPPRPRRRS